MTHPDPSPVTASTAAKAGTDAETERAARDVIAVASILTDRGDLDGFTALLRDDVHWEMPDGVTTGAAAVLDGMRARRNAGRTGPASFTKHVVVPLTVRAAGEDSMLVESNWMFLADTNATPRLVATGRYFDTLRRDEDGTWRFAKRVSRLG